MYESIRGLIDEHQTLLTWLAVGSGVMLVISLLTLPVLAVVLPADFLQRFDPDRQPSPMRQQHPALWWTLKVLRNLAGSFLLVAGLAMLVLPGQGLLTIAFAVLLLDLPGKKRLQHRLLHSPRLIGPINRIRRRYGREPLI